MVLNLCVLYDTDSIVEMYKVNEFAKYAPNYLSIGNDNGDRELVIKAEKDACVCGFLDAGAIGTAEPDEWFNFVLWIENGCEMLEEKPAEWGNISIINIPDDKLKFLMEMKGFKITHDQVLSVNSESLPENTTIKILELTSEDMI